MARAEYLYRPQHKDRTELIQDFVIRNDIYDKLLDEIAEDQTNEPSQHFLIEAKRGMGKTTLMFRLTYELQNDPKLRKHYVPCKFNEEEFGITGLAILWERVAEYLEEDERFEDLVDKLEDRKEKGSDALFEELERNLKAQDVVAVVFIDNFFQILERFEKKEHQRLREILITSNCIRIVAGSARFIGKNTGDYKAPFFEFFKNIKLQKLNREETNDLLMHLAKKHQANGVISILETQPERVDNIRILCGGVPRTLVTFFEVLMDDSEGGSVEDLKLLMDRVNELYIQRVQSLSKQEQPIVHVMALRWEAMSSGEIAKELGLASKTVSSFLNKLQKNGIIEKIPTDTKNHLYRIEERFFNIWYLMTQAPRRYQLKAKWLSSFIETLYTKREFKYRLRKHMEGIEAGTLKPDHAILMSQALASSNLIDVKQRDELIGKMRKYKGVINMLPSDSERLINSIHKYLNNQRFDKIKSELGDIKVGINRVGPWNYDHLQSLIEQAKSDSLTQRYINQYMGFLAFDLEKYELAESYWLKATTYGADNLYFLIGAIYEAQDKYSNAERYFLMDWEENKNLHALTSLGRIYIRKNEWVKAENQFLKAHEAGDSTAILKLANFLSFKDEVKSEKYYQKALEVNRTKALCDYGYYLLTRGNFSQARELFSEAFLKGNSAAIFFLALSYLADETVKYKELVELVTEIKELSHIAPENLFDTLYEFTFWPVRLDGVITSLILADEYPLAFGYMNIVFDQVKDDIISDLVSILSLFLAKKQYSYLHTNFLREPELQQRFPAIYYLVLQKMGNHDKELQKMPPELQEPIEKVELMVTEWEEVIANLEKES